MEPEGSSPYAQQLTTCPYPEPDQSSPCSQPTSWKIHCNTTLLPMPRSPKWSLSLSFPTKTLYAPLLSSIRATCPAHLIHLITQIIFDEQYRSVSSSLRSFFHSRHLVPLRPKYLLQHPILKHPQPTFLPQSQRPSFTPTQSNRQTYSSVHLNLYILV